MITDHLEGGGSHMASIGVFLMAIAFFIVAIYLSMLLLQAAKAMLTVVQTVEQVEDDLDKSIQELQGTFSEADRLATDVETKLQAAAPLFATVENVSISAKYVTEEAARRVRQFDQDGTLPGTAPFVRAIQLGEFATKALRSWQRGKQHVIIRSGKEG